MSSWRKMPRYKHWERRVGHLLLCVDTEKNWDVQNRRDDDVVTDERCSLEQGNGGSIEASKAQCEEAARAILRKMLDGLDPPGEAKTTGKHVTVCNRRYMIVQHLALSPASDVERALAVACGSNDIPYMPSTVKYIEYPRKA